MHHDLMLPQGFVDEVNKYYVLLECGALKKYGTNYVIVQDGCVVAFGPDKIELVKEYATDQKNRQYFFVARGDGFIPQAEVPSPEVV